MKIAFINIYQDIVSRGAETFVSEVSSRLSKKHKIDLISGSGRLYKSWPLLWRFFLDPNGINALLFTLKNIGKLWKNKYDIVVPLNGGWQATIVRLITWSYGGNVVIAGQSGKGWDDRINLYSFPNAFVALSDKAYKWAKAMNPLVRVVHISNGADVKKFSVKGDKYKHQLKNKVVLCVAALVPGKRIDLTIKAVSKIKNTSLLVVGSGALESDLEKLGEELLGENFKLITAKHSELPAIYRSADLFTLASGDSFSFEIVLVEAMATGLGVVANNDDIRKNIVGDAGILVNPENTEGYSKALDTALKKKWGDKPRNQAKKFDWDKIAREYEKLFLELTK